jgi:hypothetical protein
MNYKVDLKVNHYRMVKQLEAIRAGIDVTLGLMKDVDSICPQCGNTLHEKTEGFANDKGLRLVVCPTCDFGEFQRYQPLGGSKSSEPPR